MTTNGQEPREQVEERVALRTALAKLQQDIRDAFNGEGPLSPFLKPPPPPPPPVPGVDYEPPAAANFHKAGGGYPASQGPSPHELMRQDQERYVRAEHQKAMARADAQDARAAARRQAPSPSTPSEAPNEPQEAPGTPQPSSPGKSSNASSTGVSEPDAAPRIPRLRME